MNSLQMTFLSKYKEDIIYLTLLIFSVVIGGYYQKLPPKLRKWCGTVLGWILIIIVSGYNSIHLLITGILGILVIKLSPKVYCHVTGFIVSFGYLFFFRCLDSFGLPLPRGQTNLIEMILVLRISGIAFEINGSWLAKNERKKNDDHARDRMDEDEINPCGWELFHYFYNYIGLLTGPYYRYRSFDDYFNQTFSKHADCVSATVHAMRCVPLYISLFLAISTIWPLNYVETAEFANASFLYRAMYPWFLFAQFRMRIYAGMTLAECVCTAAGLGAYPTIGKNKTGHGPTANYMKIKRLSDLEASKLEYDFNTIVSVEAFSSEVTPLFRDSMKVWNKAVQYWVGMYVYKRFPIKFLRMHAALFVSVIWHGFHAGYFFCIFFSPFYVMAEDIFANLFYHHTTGWKRVFIAMIFWFMRVHYQSYQTVAFLLLSFDRCWKFYTLMNHYLYIIWAGAFVFGLFLQRIWPAPPQSQTTTTSRRTQTIG